LPRARLQPWTTYLYLLWDYMTHTTIPTYWLSWITLTFCCLASNRNPQALTS
jgi:hypothetical protein